MVYHPITIFDIYCDDSNYTLITVIILVRVVMIIIACFDAFIVKEGYRFEVFF